MRKIFLLPVVLISVRVLAQNVGIGTTTPAEKLEVRNGLRSTVKISSGSFNDTTGLLLSNRDGVSQGTDFSIRNIREEGLFFSSLSDLPGNNSDNSLVIRPDGQVGVGIMPTAKLDINGGVKLQGLNLFEFGAGVPGKEVNAGKIGYNGFGQNGLTIVGGGTNVTNRAVFFYAEGGTTMNGPLNIGGPLRINGNAGTAGQVLTSNGTGNPSWADAAYGNNIRFAFRFEESASAINDYTRFTGTRYNLNTSQVVFGTNSITLNQTGLYRFEILLSASAGFASTPPQIPQLYLGFYNGLASPFVISNYKPMQATTFSSPTAFKMDETYSIEIYVSAPANISFFHNLTAGAAPTSFQIEGHLIGHLISE